MKVHNHIVRTTLLLVVLTFLLLADLADAQRFPTRPRFEPGGRTSLAGGMFYIQGASRWRNIQTFEMNHLAHNIRYEEPGFPPFGPNVDGDFGTPAGKPGYNIAVAPFTNLEEGFPRTPTNDAVAPFDPPRESGNWVYNDGHINSRVTAIGGAAWTWNDWPDPVYGGGKRWVDLPRAFPSRTLFPTLSGSSQ